MTWKLNHCPDSVLWSSVSCQSLEEGSRSCNLERARGHWHGDNQNYFTTQLQMLVTNIFTSLTAPSTQIRARVRLRWARASWCSRVLKDSLNHGSLIYPRDLFCWSSPCVLFLCLVTRKAANCKLKESRLGWTRVFGPRPKVPALLANIQTPGEASEL